MGKCFLLANDDVYFALCDAINRFQITTLIADAGAIGNVVRNGRTSFGFYTRDSIIGVQGEIAGSLIRCFKREISDLKIKANENFVCHHFSESERYRCP